MMANVRYRFLFPFFLLSSFVSQLSILYFAIIGDPLLITRAELNVQSERKAGLGSITNFVDPKDNSGEFKRQTSTFRGVVSREAQAEFPAERGRYHLYVSYACPWGMNLLLLRNLFLCLNRVLYSGWKVG